MILCAGHQKAFMLKGLHLYQLCSTTSSPLLVIFFLCVILPELLTHAIKDGEVERRIILRDTFGLCGEGEHRRFIACDNPSCSIEWYHYKCVGITKKPQGKWYCPTCK